MQNIIIKVNKINPLESPVVHRGIIIDYFFNVDKQHMQWQFFDFNSL